MQNYLTEVPTTMSSREIVELTEKKHGHVIRDIEKILNDLGEPLSKFGSSYLASNGKQEKEYLLPKREALILIYGYSVAQRAAIIDRWLTLEGDYASMSECEQMLWHAQRLVDQERKVKALEVQQVETKAQLTALVAGENFFTVVRFANAHAARLDGGPSSVSQRCRLFQVHSVSSHEEAQKMKHILLDMARTD